MDALPPAICTAVEAELGPVRDAVPLSGGDVSRAVRVGLHSGGEVVVKWRADAPADLFACEADGLELLGASGPLRVPCVLAVGSNPPFLALEYVPPRPVENEARFARRLAEGLAALHHTPSPTAAFGLDRDNYLGSQPQPNGWHDCWPAFYRDCRLRPQVTRAQGGGLLPLERAHALHAVLDSVDNTLADLDARPVLVHGDLWSGNFLCAAGDEPVLLDPAAHYAEREVELAYTELFGGFPRGFREAYRAAFPLSDGYERRRPLHQLYPLLIHLNHFGEQYGPAVDRACRDILRLAL